MIDAAPTPELSKLAGKLAAEVSSSVTASEPLAKYTTIGLGGPADLFVEAASISDLGIVLQFARQHQLEITILGDGSNVLIADSGIRGIVIRLTGEFDEVSFDGDILTCGAGTGMSQAITASANEGLAGIEVVYGVPGSVGGGVFMNAGTRYGWISDTLIGCEVFDLTGQGRWVSEKDLAMSYRFCVLQQVFPQPIVTFARFQLKQQSSESIKSAISEMAKRRQESQPLNWRSCGCIFRNPDGDSAGRVIDSAGLKGLQSGGATVSDKHANFIVTGQDAKAQDVYHLMKSVQKLTLERTGVELHPEVRLLGEWPDE